VRRTSGFEQNLAHGVLRRVEVKELLFAEGDPAGHVYRIETGAIASTRCWPTVAGKSLVLLIPAT
jgi:hypothetical protein